jgi:RPA family protein
MVKMFQTVEGNTEAEKIKKIKETTNDLETYKADYEKWEKLIKFSDKQKAELAAIKTGLGESPDSTDNIQTYREKLKNFDPELETKFTEDLMTK